MRDLFGSLSAGLFYKGAWEDGRLFCCCTPPSDCCLYPWPDPEGTSGGPFYPGTDLPATVVLDGITMTRSGYQYTGSGFPPAPVSGNTDRVIDASSAAYWELYDATGELIQVLGACLIVDLGAVLVEDEFPDMLNYSLDTLPPDPLTGSIDRQTNCKWGEGADEAQIVYGGDVSEPYKWALEALGYAGWFVKDDPQDSPVGVYRQSGDTVTITA